MFIKRDFYLNKLIESKNIGMVKVITGLRRSGKSFLLFDIFKNHLLNTGTDLNHIIEINFDDFESERFHDPHITYDYIKSRITDDKMYYILLDEIQLLDKFESVLNSLLRRNNVNIYVTGSNAKFLSKDVITEFRGRGWQIHVDPLSFKEFLDATKLDKDSALDQYMIYGGLPATVDLKETDKRSYLNRLFIETYLKDIVDRNKIKDTSAIQSLIDIVSSSIGSLTNPTKLSKAYESLSHTTLSSITISSYLDYLKDSFLISEAKRYDVKGKKYISTPYKYYFSDLGIRNSILNFRQLEKSHLLENLIYNELKRRGFSVDVGNVMSRAISPDGKEEKKYLEIDFVCNLADTRYYIQSAYSLPDEAKWDQESKSLNQVKDNFKKIIITKDTITTHYNNDGILVLDIFDFLLNDDSLKI